MENLKSKTSSYIKRVFNPPIFQGDLDRESYFEGWYYKLVARDESRRFAIIPGVSLDRKRGTSHAFIQTIDGDTAQTQYYELPLAEFKPSENAHDIRIGDSRFTGDVLELDIENDLGELRGSLSMANRVPWPRKLLAPGVMGWYSFVPFMECYHGLVSLDHDLAGTLIVNGESIDFTGGKGYTEKDWGTSFPDGYIWMQSNHFGSPQTSLMASIARIPWLGAHFTGYLVALLVEGELYRFTTYTGARLRDLSIERDVTRFQLQDHFFRVEIEASRSTQANSRDRENVVQLRSPNMGEMKGRIGEALTATISVRLFKRKRLSRDQLIFSGTGTSAGLEIETTQAQMEQTSRTRNPTLKRFFLFKS